MVAVQVNRVVRHREIAHAHPYAVAFAHDERIDSGEYPGVPGPDVEIRHLGDLRDVGPWLEGIGAHDEREVAIDAVLVRIAAMNDEGAHHAPRHLHPPL